MSNSGGTLTLPSPTHVHHVDVQAGLRSLRRSLSRSPSKFSLVRTASQSSSSAGSSPSSPSCRRVQSQYFGHQPNSPAPTSFHGQSPLATPFRPSVKLSLRSAKKSPGISSSKPLRHRTSPRTSPRGSPRTSPRSPAPPRRALHATSNIANSTTPTSTPPDHNASGQENLNIFGSRSPTARKAAEKPSNRHSMHLDISGASSQLSMSRAADANTPITVNSLASPLKRSDANMNLDQTLSGSPRAKRRSFGPSNFGSEFNIFDQSPGSPDSDIQDDASREYDWTGPGIELASSPTPSVMPRRAGSLRRSTLQQRHTSERTSWGRRQGSQQLSQISHDATTTPNAKNRPRLSLDHFLPPPQRDSPFSQGGPLPNPSAHMIPQPAHQPHPLSRAMTTSSSNSSMVDDSPTHHPVQISEKPRAPMNWSKSLPLGALRPQPDRETGPTASVSTPDYKHARPFEGAFASTGLVSKMNRNPEAAPPAQRGFGFVPDTPCKKISGFNTYPPPPGSGGSGRRRRHIRHSFGTPSTPFNPPSVRAEDTFAEQSRPVLFNGFATRHSRKGSLLSLHSEDGRSPQTSEESVDSMIGIDEGIPPTPTKTQLIDDGFGQLTNDSPTTNRHMPVASPAFTNSLNSQRGPATNCKLSPPEGPYSDGGSRDPGDAICDDGDPDVPTVITGGTPPSISISMPASSQDRAKRGCMSTPAPLKTTCATPSIMTTTKIRFAKTDSALPASPLDRLEFADGASPHTPQDNVMPPDASRLSISNQAETSLFPFSGERKATFPPATPTTRPDTFSFFQDRRAITPVNGMAPRDLDETLVSRFGKVEYVGKGEFSQVYKVTELAKPAMKAQQSFFSTPTHRTPPSPSGKCFAVKKLSLPFQGDKDRAFRLREVSIMRSLQGCDHVLQLIDSWEHKNSLYIQTEYCEEGSLDVFLSLVGTKGRLDDFRIWKTMLEVTQGLQHIHDAGFVHLDLKPANILITFEGTLKIGDFGLATSLPADKGPDLEGDREYLAPEALRSEIDKPADIFSLGLIMLEIAANVKLPENGATWTALREGDFTEVPTLTQDATAISRDATGMPIEDADRSANIFGGESTPKHLRRTHKLRGLNRHSNDIFGLGRKNELQDPPEFMKDPSHQSSLDTVVRSMLAAEPMCRPTIHELMELESLAWVATRQRAGATVFEGNWGPADEVVDPCSVDTEMTDV